MKSMMNSASSAKSKTSLSGFIRFLAAEHKVTLVVLALLVIATAVVTVPFAMDRPMNAAISAGAVLFLVTKLPWAWYTKSLDA